MMSLSPAETRNAGSTWGAMFTVTQPSMISAFKRVREKSVSRSANTRSRRLLISVFSTENWCLFGSIASLLCLDLSD